MSEIYKYKPDFGSSLERFIDEPNTEELRHRIQLEIEKQVTQYTEKGLSSIQGNNIYASDFTLVQGLVMAGKLEVARWYEVYISNEHVGKIRFNRGPYTDGNSIQWDADMEFDDPSSDRSSIQLDVKLND